MTSLLKSPQHPHVPNLMLGHKSKSYIARSWRIASAEPKTAYSWLVNLPVPPPRNKALSRAQKPLFSQKCHIKPVLLGWVRLIQSYQYFVFTDATWTTTLSEKKTANPTNPTIATSKSPFRHRRHPNQRHIPKPKAGALPNPGTGESPRVRVYLSSKTNKGTRIFHLQIYL